MKRTQRDIYEKKKRAALAEYWGSLDYKNYNNWSAERVCINPNTPRYSLQNVLDLSPSRVTDLQRIVRELNKTEENNVMPASLSGYEEYFTPIKKYVYNSVTRYIVYSYNDDGTVASSKVCEKYYGIRTSTTPPFLKKYIIYSTTIGHRISDVWSKYVKETKKEYERVFNPNIQRKNSDIQRKAYNYGLTYLHQRRRRNPYTRASNKQEIVKQLKEINYEEGIQYKDVRCHNPSVDDGDGGLCMDRCWDTLGIHGNCLHCDYSSEFLEEYLQDVYLRECSRVQSS